MSSPRMTQAQSPASLRKIRIAYIGWVRPGPGSGASLALQRHLYGGGEFEVFVGTHTPYAGLGLPERWQSLSRTKIHERALRTRVRRVLAQYEMLLEPVLFAKQIERAIREFAPDVLLTVPDNTLSWAAYRLSRKLGLPLVSNFQDWWPRGQIHSLLETPYAWVRRMLETRFRKIYQESVVAFCTSEGFRRFLGPHPCAPLLYPCPADRPSPRPLSSPPRPDRPIRVVYGGTLFRYYGEKMLALAKVAAQNPSIDLRLFGGTPDWSAQDLDWAQKSGIYRGLLTNEEFRRELLEADVLIAAMTSAPELETMMRTSFTTKFLEYCQFAKPVIIWGPEYCEPVRVALETGAGLAVTDESPELVVEKIIGLRDPNAFQIFADGAWSAATTFFDPQPIHSTFVDAIHRVIIERK